MSVLKPLSAADVTSCRIFSGDVSVVRTTHKARTSFGRAAWASESEHKQNDQISVKRSFSTDLSILVTQRHLDVSRQVSNGRNGNRAKVCIGDRRTRNAVLHVIERIEQIGTKCQLVTFPRHREDLRDAEIHGLHTVAEKSVAAHEVRRVGIG